MKVAALKASLALWKRRYAKRVKMRDTARRELNAAVAANVQPRKALMERKILREQQAEQARRMVERREAQITQAGLPKVSPPLGHILEDSWGWHPGVHDGIDLICPPDEPLFAICKATVVRAAPSGWWGLGAPADPALKAKGDGIIILRSLVNAGPIRKGMNLCYGHAEHATVTPGQVVEAGQVIGKAGFANAWHTHFMVNQRPDTKGVGDQDPKPVVDYSRKVNV